MNLGSQERTLTSKAIGTRWVLPWLLGSIAAYFLTSFFSNFYPFSYQFVLLSLLFQVFCGVTAFLFLRQDPQVELSRDPLGILTLLIAFLLSISAVLISLLFPGLFDRRLLFMDAPRLPIFILLSLISFGLAIVPLKRMNENGFFDRVTQARFFRFAQENFAGLLLATFFLVAYLVFAESINFPSFRTLDLYFDTDISEWLARLTATTRQEVGAVRAVHPAVLLVLRSVVAFISVLVNGDRLQAVFIMNALAGASCVLLAWLIIKRATGNRTYSSIMASILGVSTSHLLLSSMLETYIYSAMALLFFTFLIQNEKTALKFTVPAGILVFGITVTNLIQTCILYFLNYPRLKVLLKYVFMVLLITAALHLLQIWFYPNARSAFQPSNLAREQYYILNPFEFSWRSAGRFALIARAIPLYGIVAPTPFILMAEVGMDVPNFRTYQILSGEFHIAGYRGLADVTVKLWIIILAAAGVLFILRLWKTPKQALFPLSLLLCVGFNFVLHIVYGDDPMLYSPDWVYALVLFVALAFQRWADRRWFQLVMMGFLVLLMTTNLRLIHQIMEVSAPFYSLSLP